MTSCFLNPQEIRGQPTQFKHSLHSKKEEKRCYEFLELLSPVIISYIMYSSNVSYTDILDKWPGKIKHTVVRALSRKRRASD